MTTSTIKAERKIALPTRYPALTMTSALSQVMVTVSPPVSPRVVARILMTQKPSVTSGTLVSWNFTSLLIRPDVTNFGRPAVTNFGRTRMLGPGPKTAYFSMRADAAAKQKRPANMPGPRLQSPYRHLPKSVARTTTGLVRRVYEEVNVEQRHWAECPIRPMEARRARTK